MFKQIYILVLLGILFASLGVLAGTFTPTPATPDSSFYTLSDIYNKITAGTSAPAHTFAPTGAPDSTFVTLTQIWDAIPPFKTLVVNDLSSGILPAGIYATSTDLTTIEPNLTAANIATGTVLFGVTGTCVTVPPPPPVPPVVAKVVTGNGGFSLVGDYYEDGTANGYIQYSTQDGNDHIQSVAQGPDCQFNLMRGDTVYYSKTETCGESYYNGNYTGVQGTEIVNDPFGDKIVSGNGSPSPNGTYTYDGIQGGAPKWVNGNWSLYFNDNYTSGYWYLTSGYQPRPYFGWSLLEIFIPPVNPNNTYTSLSGTGSPVVADP